MSSSNYLLALAILATALSVVFGSACGGTYRGSRYVISSPNYPRPYPGRQDCIYHLQAEASLDDSCEPGFHLRFQEFDVRCDGDYLRIWDKESSGEVLCGENLAAVGGIQRKLRVRNDTLILEFHSDDDQDAGRGFQILVTTLPCSPRSNHENEKSDATSGRRNKLTIEGQDNPKTASEKLSDESRTSDARRLGSGSIYDPRWGLLDQGGFQGGFQGNRFNVPGAYGYSGGYGGYGGYPIESFATGQGRRFLLTSPGFPIAGASSPVGPFACRYAIAKSSPDVCRLRLTFRFFNFGAEDDPYCERGTYVEIDGRRLCGCRSGQSFVVPFSEWGYVKQIVVAQAGGYYPPSQFRGFAIDVAQESCSYPGSYTAGGASYPYTYPQVGYRPPRGYPFYSSGLLTREFREKRDTFGHDSTGYRYDEPSVPFEEQQQIQQQPNLYGNERLFGSSCRNRLLVDWVLASKELALRGGTGGRCERFG